MSQEGINPAAAAVNDVNIAQALMEEDLQREIARNEAANKMVRDREMAAMVARKRAEQSQLQMQAMLAKYEDMRTKLDSTKKHLDETNTKLEVQEKLTDKISKMKERVEAYANKKEAVAALNEHVKIKQDLHIKKLDVVKETLEENTTDIAVDEKERYDKMKKDLEDNAARVDQLKIKMSESEEVFAKKEELKKRLERAVELGEKRASEQNRLTEAREKMLELKLKELQLQKAKLERKRREQENREKATNDFFNVIDKELEDMKSNVVNTQEQNKPTGTVPKQKQNKNKGKGKKSKSSTPNVMSPKVMSPEPTANTVPTESVNKVNSKSQYKTKKAQQAQAKAKEEDDVSNDQILNLETNAIETEPAQGKQEDKTDSEKSEAQALVKEQFEKMPLEVNTSENEKMSEDEVKATVARIEGKVKSARGDIADMAMSEQYLRTKQALLMAKKKEQEMQIAQNIAELREAEVTKMREKVKHMQELLASKKQKLKTTEEIMEAKNEEKKAIDKQIEKTKRKENYIEKEIVDRVIFEKEPPKKK